MNLSETGTDLLDLFKTLVNTEKEYAERLKKTAEKTENLGVGTLIEAVAMDSLKHSMIYDSIVKGLSKTEYLTKPEAGPITGEIDYHIATEAEFIKKLQEIIPKCRDESVKFLLRIILEDEIRHHAVLRTLKEFIKRKEERLTEALWKYLEAQLREKQK